MAIICEILNWYYIMFLCGILGWDELLVDIWFKNKIPKPLISCCISCSDHRSLSLWLRCINASSHLERLASYTASSLLWYFFKKGSLDSLQILAMLDSFWGLWTKWLLFPSSTNPHICPPIMNGLRAESDVIASLWYKKSYG